MQEEETCNLPETSKAVNPKAPRGNNVATGCYQRMPAGPPLEDHPREKMPLWKHHVLGQVIGHHIGMGRIICWNKSNTMLVVQTQYLAGHPGKNGDTVPP